VEARATATAAAPPTCPAALIATGRVNDSPAPNSASPARPATGVPISKAAPKPTPASSAPARNAVTGPTQATTRSPAARPMVIAAENAATPAAAIPGAAPTPSRR
jgi:hypothetical protein